MTSICSCRPSASKASRRINRSCHRWSAPNLLLPLSHSSSSSFFRHHQRNQVKREEPPLEVQEQQQQRKETEGNDSPRTGGLPQGGRTKRTRKLRMEVDWTLLLLPPSPKGKRKRQRKKEGTVAAAATKAKISKKKPKKQDRTLDKKRNQD